MAVATFVEIENDDGSINYQKARDLYAEAQRVSERIDELETITAEQFQTYLTNYILESDSRPSRKLILQRLVSRAQRMIDAKMQEMNVEAGKVQDYTVIAKELVNVVLETVAPYQTI